MRIGQHIGNLPGSGIDSVKKISGKIETRLVKLVKGTSKLWGRMVGWSQNHSLSKGRAEKRQAEWNTFKENVLPEDYGPKIARQAIATWEAEKGSTSLTDRKVSLSKEKAKVRAHATAIQSQIRQIELNLRFDDKDYYRRLPQGSQPWPIAAKMNDLMQIEKNMKFEDAFDMACKEFTDNPDAFIGIEPPGARKPHEYQWANGTMEPIF